MKHLSITIISVLTLGTIIGCASRARPLFDFTYASTKEKNISPQEGKEISKVTSDFICTGKDGYGLMETATNNALAKTDGATYLKDASFSVKDSCVQVTGIAYK
jgi:hypothetical protein